MFISNVELFFNEAPTRCWLVTEGRLTKTLSISVNNNNSGTKYADKSQLFDIDTSCFLSLIERKLNKQIMTNGKTLFFNDSCSFHVRCFQMKLTKTNDRVTISI